MIAPVSALDLRAITETLRGGKANEAWLVSWLPSSHADPEGFSEAMFAFAAARRDSAFKSRVREGFDLYHDCVSAHQGRRRMALIGRDGDGWVGVSYEELHGRCNALASAWVEQAASILEVSKIALREYRDGIYPQDVQLIRQYIQTCQIEYDIAARNAKWSNDMLKKGLRARSQVIADELSVQPAAHDDRVDRRHRAERLERHRDAAGFGLHHADRGEFGPPATTAAAPAAEARPLLGRPRLADVVIPDEGCAAHQEEKPDYPLTQPRSAGPSVH